MTALQDAAAFLAQQWPVFPCRANKKPATEHGFKDAVRDPEAARRLFGLPNAALIGVPTGAASGLVVVDIDVRGEVDGLGWLKANEDRLPRTRRHRTASGGFHLLFLYPEGRHIRNTASRIHSGVDTRGEGGYIIVPPSAGYSIVDDAMPAPVPSWLLEVLDPPPAPMPPRAPLPPRPHGRDRLDGTPYGLAGLDRECQAIRTAGHGSKHDTLNRGAYSIGGLVAAGEVAEGLAFAALASALHDMHARAPCDDYRAAERTLATAFRDGMAKPRQAPPPREVRHTIRIEMGQPEAPWPATMPDDYRTVPDPDPDIGGHTDHRSGTTDNDTQRQNPTKSRFRTLSIADVLALPPPEWLIEGILTTGGYAAIYGPPASLKSFTCLGMGLAVAYGDAWAGRTVKQAGVLYVAGEGARGLGKRIRAWQQHHGREGTDAPFRILSDGVNLTNPADTADLILAAKEAAEAEGQPIGLIFIDTVARAMVGADENSAQDMGRFNESCAEIIRALDNRVTVVGVHHTGKDAERGPRGSNSLTGAIDTLLRVTRSEDRLTLLVQKQKDDEDGFEVHLKLEGVREPDADAEAKPYSLVIVDASAEPALKARRDKGKGPPPAAQLALTALEAALVQWGIHRRGMENVPGAVQTVTEREWREAFYSRSAAPNQSAKQLAFKRAHEELAARGLVVLLAGFAWIVRPE